MSRLHCIVSAALAGCAALLVAGAASAQTSRLPQSDWRRSARPEPDSGPSFAFEVRFGPYYPQVDEEFTAPGPYERAFDNDPQFYFGIELDWLPLRIPYVGGVGPGIGWGYTATSAKAKLTRDGTTESSQDTSLSIMPMHLSAVVRFDELMRRTVVPIVPFFKLGLGLGLWSAGTSSDTAEVDGTLGRDTTWGLHMAIGGALALNFLDPRSSASLDETTGINHVYLFGEWMNASLDGIGSRPQMHIGSSSWVVGLTVDM